MPPYNLAIYHRKHCTVPKNGTFIETTQNSPSGSQRNCRYMTATQSKANFSLTIQRYVSRPSCHGQTIPLSTQGREPACPTTVQVIQIFRFAVSEVVIKLKTFIILYRLQLSKRKIERFKIRQIERFKIHVQAGSHVESGTV
jgi:hypothetical protein